MTKSIIEVIKYHNSDNFDIVAAVISSSTDRILKRAEIIVGDHSLQSYECARVQLRKLNDREMDECIMIHRGDIIRFNSLCLRKKYGNSADGETFQSAAEHKLSNCVCDFHHPPKCSLSVQRFAKVGAVCGRHIMIKTNQGGDLETDRNIIDQVGQWFRETHESIHVNDSNRLHAKRKLCELIIPNMKSDVLIRVLQIDSDERSIQKYDSSGNYVNSEYAQIIVIDGEGVETEDDSKVLYVLRNSSLLVKIRECFQRQETFLLRDVMTQKITKNIKPICMNGEMNHSVILVPSYKTCLEIVPQMSRNKSKCIRSHGDSNSNCCTAENLNLTPVLDSTQASFYKFHRESNFIKQIIAHLSSLRVADVEISIDSVSCLEHYTDFFSKCVRKKECDDFMNPQMILTIHPQGDNQETLKVLAGIDIIVALCGCCDLSDLQLLSEEHSTFLKALMSLKVPLKWSLTHNHTLNVINVEAVSMPSLDFD